MWGEVETGDGDATRTGNVRCEAIQVKNMHRDVVLIALCVPKRLFQPFVETGTVGQAGQGIVAC